jgi:hypothetical protein
MDAKNCLEELTLCLQLWKEKGGCTFGKKTKCAKCAAPYVLYKMLTKKILHGQERLSLEEWKVLLKDL